MTKKIILPLMALAFAPLAIGGVLEANAEEGTQDDPASSAGYGITYAGALPGALTFETAPETAIAGEKVSFTLAYDATLVAVDSVQWNGLDAAEEGAKSYSFKMPAEAVEVTVAAHSLEEPVTYAVHLANDAEQGVVLAGLKEAYEPGETVSFNVTFAAGSGYTYAGSAALYTGYGTDAEAPFEGATFSGNSIAFAMPAEDVHIQVKTAVRGFLLSEDTSSSNISSVKAGSKTVWGSAAFVKYGEEVTVTLKDTNALKATGIKFDGTDVTYALEGEDKTITFKMPAYNVKVLALTEQIYKAVSLTPSEHATLTLGAYDTDTSTFTASETASFAVDSTVYLKASAESGYTIDELTATYNTSSKLALTSVADDIYSFKMPAYDLSITNTELASLYAGKPFVGTYQGANVCRSSVYISFTSSYSLSIDEYGRIIKGTSSKVTHTITGVDEENKFISLKDTSTSTGVVAYGTNVIVGYYNLSGKNQAFGTDKVNDFLVAWKTGSDETATWGMRGIRFGEDTYMLSVCLKNGEFYDAAFVDIANKKAYTDGVTIAYDEGYTDMSDSGASYTISLDGVASYKVTGQTSIAAVAAE